MSAMDHRKSSRLNQCTWCHDEWPCKVAEIRNELADRLRDQLISSTGAPDYDDGREAGVQFAADIIDADL